MCLHRLTSAVYTFLLQEFALPFHCLPDKKHSASPGILISVDALRMFTFGNISYFRLSLICDVYNMSCWQGDGNGETLFVKTAFIAQFRPSAAAGFRPVHHS